MLGYLFEEIEVATNPESSMQVSPCTTASHAKISYILYAQQFFLPPLICHHSVNVNNCSKYCTSIADYNENLVIHYVFLIFLKYE